MDKASATNNTKAPEKVVRSEDRKPSIEDYKDRIRKVYREGNGVRLKHHIPADLKEEGYNYAWPSDILDKIQNMQELGWEFVRNRAGELVKIKSSRSLDSRSSESILMKIPTELYNEIRAVKHEQLNKDHKARMSSSDQGLSGVSYSETVER